MRAKEKGIFFWYLGSPGIAYNEESWSIWFLFWFKLKSYSPDISFLYAFPYFPNKHN